MLLANIFKEAIFDFSVKVLNHERDHSFLEKTSSQCHFPKYTALFSTCFIKAAFWCVLSGTFYKVQHPKRGKIKKKSSDVSTYPGLTVETR